MNEGILLLLVSSASGTNGKGFGAPLAFESDGKKNLEVKLQKRSSKAGGAFAAPVRSIEQASRLVCEGELQ